MSNEITVVQMPTLWVQPSGDEFELEKEKFLASDDENYFKLEDKMVAVVDL